MRRILIVLAALALVISVEASASARTTRQASATARAASPAQEERRFLCNEGDPLCAETAEAIGYEGRYTGHDEPSVLYYSDKPGSGNNNRYRVVVAQGPADPADPGRDRGHLQLPEPDRVLVRDGPVRQPVGARVHPPALHAQQ